MALQLLFLFTTMQATASNYIHGVPFFWHLLAKTGNTTSQTGHEEPATCDYDPCNMEMVADCGFLVTSATILPNGNYEICVQANDDFLPQTWAVWEWSTPPALATGSAPNMCWEISSTYGPGFSIWHTVTDDFGTDTCKTFILILHDSFCVEDLVRVEVIENCDLEANILIDVTNISTPYVITFGDGSLAVQSSATEIEHTYDVPGTYEVCLTYAVPGKEGTVTCCDSIEIAMPYQCICPEDAINVVIVEPCTWETVLLFALDSEVLPITVDFGDGTAVESFNSLWIDHEFPEPGNYYVCYEYEAFPGDTLQCCEWVNIPGCCLDPTFSIGQIVPSPSCINPLYRISDVECPGGIVESTHIWVYSDSFVYYGSNPPDHVFTNFLNDTGWVSVTHYIICCEDTASHTEWIQHPQGAWLGNANQSLSFSDILPFTGETVLQFIYDNADGTQPFIVDGQLNADMNAYFTDGTWNMARNSVVVVEGGAGKVRDFSLDGTLLRSAVWLPGSPPCCRWQGVQSRDLTNISLTDAWIRDANYAIHYPGGGAGDSNFPALSSESSHYINNYYGIKSEGKFVNFLAFSGNEMKGTHVAPETEICDCDAVNAIDFREVNPLLTIKINAPSNDPNTIFNYEKGFNFVNTKLHVRGFDIYSLRDFGPIPSPFPTDHNNGPGPDDAAIGIDYAWSKSNKSSLDLDRITFSDFVGAGSRSVAVRDSITAGKHALKAIASAPYSSITTYNVAGGYELIVGSGGGMVGEIKENSIHTNGTNYGFGINGNMASANNTLNILGNRLSIGCNTTSSLNSGIVLASPTEVDQDYTINDNDVNVLLSVGSGIGISNAKKFNVWRNTLTNSADIPGILLRDGGLGIVNCNTIEEKDWGIKVENSGQNRYASNFFHDNEYDMEFSLDDNSMSNGGTEIWWNSFDDSDNESIHYNSGAVTGQQHHTRYNSWTDRSGNEAVHATPLFGDQCQFFRPILALPNTVNWPLSNTSSLFTSTSLPATGKPLDFCEIEATDSPPMDTLRNPGGEWSALVQDTTYWDSLTAAEKTTMEQQLYGLLLVNPSWTDSTVLASFQTAKASDFVGQSETLKRNWQVLLQDISAHQASLDPTRDVLDSLSNLADQWIVDMTADTTLQDSLNALLAAVFAEGDSLSNLLEQADSIFYLSVQDSVGALLTWNATLDEDSLYTWYEKRYNGIALNWLVDNEPDSTAIADLRQMAQTCLRYGGRAVLGARGLCEVWLREYYGEDNCDGNIQTRSAGRPALAKMKTNSVLYIVPNPADDLVRIYLSNNLKEIQLVQIFNLNGQLVHTANLPLEIGSLSLSVGNWPEGIYVARVMNGNESFSQNFVVQHRH